MRIWGRIADGVVCELVHSDRAISELFHPALHWVDMTDQAEVAEGWLWDGERAHGPAAASVTDIA
jgi:hypothetical protein